MKYFLPIGLILSLSACSGGSRTPTEQSPPPPPPPPNMAPVASSDTASTRNGQSVTIDVLSNDTDANNDTLTIASVAQPASGSVAIENNQLVYTPSGSAYAGTVNFSYEVSDATTTSSADVEVNVSQFVAFEGRVLAADSLNSVTLKIEIGDEVFESVLDTNGGFALDYETTVVDSRDVSFELMRDNQVIFLGSTLAFNDVVNRRGGEAVFSFDTHAEMLISPISTAVEALNIRFGGSNLASFEQQIDGDALLQLAAISSLIAKGELNPQGELLTVLNDDEQLETLALSLLLDTESISVDSEDQDGVEGLIAVGSRLQTEIDELRSLIAPFNRFEVQGQTSSSINANQTSSNTGKLEANSEVLADYYQLKPSYNGRIASYNFVGAQLTLMQDGSGVYYGEHAQSSLNWEAQEDNLLITLDTPIPTEYNLSLSTLNVRGLIEPDTYIEARNRIGGSSFTSFINSFKLTRLFNGEAVDIITTDFEINIKINEDPELPPEVFTDATALGVDDYLRSSIQELEYVETTEQINLPFTAQEITGVWGFAIAGSATSQFSSSSRVDELTGIFADLVTFDADGSMQSEFHSVTGTWQINDDGTLTVVQEDGYTLTYRRISQDAQANGMLIRASSNNDETFSQFRMAIKRTTQQLDLSLIRNPEYLWNGNWGLSNPNNYNADGTYKTTSYFGFQFSDDASVPSYLLGYLYILSPELEIVVRNRARHLVEGENNTINMERRSTDAFDRNADCDSIDTSCTTFWRRQWTPLGQSEDRYYVLEHFYFNLDLITNSESDDPLYFQPRGRVIFYEKLDYPEGVEVSQ